MLSISQRNLVHHPPFGLTSRVQVTIQHRNYVVHVLMRQWKTGELKTSEDLRALCDSFSNNSQYKFCPGIDSNYYETEYYAVIRFHIKSIRRWEFPFIRTDSINCSLWFLLAANASKEEKDAKEVMCGGCKRLLTDLNYQKKRTSAESPARKIKRQSASSRAKLVNMSPYSQQKRKQNVQNARTNSFKKLTKYEESEIILDGEQHDEMCSIVENTEAEVLAKIFEEGDEHGVGDIMKEIWVTDKKREQQQFKGDQANNSKVVRLVIVC